MQHICSAEQVLTVVFFYCSEFLHGLGKKKSYKNVKEACRLKDLHAAPGPLWPGQFPSEWQEGTAKPRVPFEQPPDLPVGLLPLAVLRRPLEPPGWVLVIVQQNISFEQVCLCLLARHKGYVGVAMHAYPCREIRGSPGYIQPGLG